MAKLASIASPTSLFGDWSASFGVSQIYKAKLTSKHKTSNICLPTSKNVFDLNEKHFLLADVQNVLVNMFEKLGGGETSKQGHAIETISRNITIQIF